MPIWGDSRITWRQVLPPVAVVVAIVAVGLLAMWYRASGRTSLVASGAQYGFYMSQLRSGDAGTAAAAARLLGELGDRRAIPALRTCLDREDSLVVGAAAGALGKLGDRESLSRIAPLVDSEEPALAGGAAEALGALGHKEAVGSIIKLLETEDNRARLTAIIALGRLGDGAAVPALERLQDDPCEDLDREPSDDEREEFNQALSDALARLGSGR